MARSIAAVGCRALVTRVGRVGALGVLVAIAGCYTSHVRSPAELRDVSGVEARVTLKNGSVLVLRDLAIRGDSLFGTEADDGTRRVVAALDSVERLEETVFDPIRPVLIAGGVLIMLVVVLSAIVSSSLGR